MTSSVLCDYVVATPTVTLQTPFVQLGLSPEGCSTFTFGKAAKEALLDLGKRVDAHEAMQLGLVDEVVQVGGAAAGGSKAEEAAAIERRNAAVVARAVEVAREWVAAGRVRPIIEQGLVDKLRAVNAVESRNLGLAIVSPPFIQAQMAGAEKKNQTAAAWTFWMLLKTQPLWSKI